MNIYDFSREKEIRMDIYRVWYVHLKWIQELFHTWLSSVAHEMLKLYERRVTIYLYGSLDSDGYMELPEGFHLRKTYNQNYWRNDIICPF